MKEFYDYLLIAIVAIVLIHIVWSRFQIRQVMGRQGKALRSMGESLDIAERSLEIGEESLKLQQETVRLLLEISAKLSTQK